MTQDTRPKPYSLRLTADLSQWVKERAKTGDRSINAEINRILKRMMEGDEQKAAFDRANNP